MKLRKVRTGIDFEVRDLQGRTQEELKKLNIEPDVFRLIAIDTTSDDEMVPFRIQCWLTAAGFEEKVELDLPERWLQMPCYAARMWVEGKELLFRRYDHLRGYKDFPVSAEDAWELLMLDDIIPNHLGLSHELVGIKDIYFTTTSNATEILITDRKTFFMTVDQYDNNHIVLYWHKDKRHELLEFAYTPHMTQTKIRSELPKGLELLMQGDALNKQWLLERHKDL